MVRNVQEAIPEDREWSGGPPGEAGVVEWPSWRDGSGREALPEGLVWTVGPLGGPGVVGRPSRRGGSD